MTDFEIGNSELKKLIGEALRHLPHSSSARGTSTHFLPWFTLNEQESEEKLEKLTAALGLPLLIVPAQYSVTQDARVLVELADKLCAGNGIDDLKDALERLPYSAALEDAVIEKLKSIVGGKSQLAIAALKPGADADSAVSRMLDRAAQIGVKSVLIFAHRRPPGVIKIIDLPVRTLRQDVRTLLLPLISKDAEASPAPSGVQSNGGGKATDRATSTPSFYQKLLKFFGRTAAGQEKTSLESTQDSASSAPSAEEPVDPLEDWADLLTRLSSANWGIATAIATGWEKAGVLAKAQELAAAKEQEQPKEFEPKREGELMLDNDEEREVLELRLRFVEMLRVLYPHVFDAAARELDGADQLYRILLTLCGETLSDSLVASNLLPFWQAHIDDPLFCELCYACFNEIGRDRALIPRFESRSQLYRLLAMAEENSGDGSAYKELDDLYMAHRKWLRKIAATEKSDVSAAYESVTDLDERAGALLDHMNSTATEALQAAQILMSAFEIFPEPDAEQETPASKDDRDRIFQKIGRLTRRAISQSRAAIRFDAALLRARAHAAFNEADKAFDILRIMRRTVSEPLSRCAVDIEEAFVHERAGDLIEAMHLYEGALVAAERLGADELVARAANGCLRCDTAALARSRLAAMRARIVLQIQAARAPELAPLSKRQKPRVFFSYRKKDCGGLIGPILESLNPELEKARLAAWADQKLLEEEDFNPKIHQMLHDSDAIVLLLSPNYFDSAWCTHELHFALGQNEVRGIPLYWVWCNGADKKNQSCELGARKAFDEYIAKVYGPELKDPKDAAWQAERRGHQQAHVTERLNRIFARARILSSQPLINDGPDHRKAVEPLLKALNGAASYLRRRARLPPLTSDPQPEQEPRPPTPPLTKQSQSIHILPESFDDTLSPTSPPPTNPSPGSEGISP